MMNKAPMRNVAQSVLAQIRQRLDADGSVTPSGTGTTTGIKMSADKKVWTEAEIKEKIMNSTTWAIAAMLTCIKNNAVQSKFISLFNGMLDDVVAGEKIQQSKLAYIRSGLVKAHIEFLVKNANS